MHLDSTAVRLSVIDIMQIYSNVSGIWYHTNSMWWMYEDDSYVEKKLDKLTLQTVQLPQQDSYHTVMKFGIIDSSMLT